MLVKDMLGLSDEESDERLSDCYVKMLESYNNALHSMTDSDTEAFEDVKKQYELLESKRQEVKLDLISMPENPNDESMLFYTALDRLNTGRDIHGCKKAASILKDYLISNRDSVMGKVLLDVLEEQFEVD